MTPDRYLQKRHQWPRSDVFVVNFEQISAPLSTVSIVDFD